MSAALPVDLTTFTIAGAQGAARLDAGKYRARWYLLDTNDEAYLYRDYGAGYFSGSFRLDFAFEIDAMTVGANPNFGVVWPIMLTNVVDCRHNLFTNQNAFLGFQAYGATSFTFRLDEFVEGDAQYTSGTIAPPAVTYRRTLYASLVRDEDIGEYGTLYLYLYVDPARTIALEGVTNPAMSLALHAKADFRYLFLPNGYAWTTASTGTCSGMVGELFINNGGITKTAPEYFSVQNDDANHQSIKVTAIPWHPEDPAKDDCSGDDMDGFTDDPTTCDLLWTKATGGDSVVEEYDDGVIHWAHICADPDEDQAANAKFTVTTGTRPTWMMGCKVKWAADQGVYWAAGGACSVLAVESSDNAKIVAARVVEASGHYYWRLISTDSASTSTAHEMTPGYTYEVLVVHSVFDATLYHRTFLLWVRSSDDPHYVNWTLVDMLGSSATLYGKSYDECYIGLISATYGRSGDFYVTDVKYLSCVTWQGGLCRGGAGDQYLVFNPAIIISHNGSTLIGNQVLYSTDNGATWLHAMTDTTGIYTVFPVYDDVTGKWWRMTNVVATGGFLEEATGAEPTPFTEWTRRVGPYTGSPRCSRLLSGAAGARELIAAGRNSSATPDGAYLWRFDLQSFALQKALILKNTDPDANPTSEVANWRRASDGKLMALCRTGDVDEWNQMFSCLDAEDSVNEGANGQSGTADGNVTNKLVDSSENFTASNGTTRLQAVAVGWSVWNLNTNVRGYVKAIDSATTLSIMNAAGADLDLFPNGNEPYIMSCWGKKILTRPGLAGGVGNDFYQRTGWMVGATFGGYLWLPCADRRESNTTSTAHGISSVMKVDCEDGQIIAEREWLLNKPKSTTWAAFCFESGNGDVDAARVNGNSILDVGINMGPATYLRLDAKDNLYGALVVIGSNASTMLSSGML